MLLSSQSLRSIAWQTALTVALASAQPAAALVIDPVFDSSITSNSNSAAIEGAINSAIGALDGLYNNPVTISVDFTYKPGAPGNLESTNQDYYDVPYSVYVAALEADAAANPQNTVLATAIANLSKGNDSSGSSDMAISGAQLAMLGLGPASDSDATININSSQSFDFTRPVAGGDYDAIGGLEHELDEVLGGGGAGSTLNSINGTCPTDPTNFFCNKYGSLDLYRYSSADTPSFTTSGSATSYLSVDGGLTSVVAFNQNSGGDYADFAPPGAGDGELIQDAFNSTGQDENYTLISPEFLMEELIGWDSSVASAVPEPASLAIIGTGLAGLGWLRRRKKA